MHKCINNSIGNVYHLEQFVSDFFPYSQKQLGFDRPASIRFESDQDNAGVLLGKTAYYDPENYEVVLYVDGRHPKDVMRSLSHELVHHAQNCRGDFTGQNSTGDGYAQKDPHLREMEREAYTKGNLIFRDFEDLIKTGKINIEIDFSDSGEPEMSLKEWKNNEINTRLMKKWGLLTEAPSEKSGDTSKEAPPVTPPDSRNPAASATADIAGGGSGAGTGATGKFAPGGGAAEFKGLPSGIDEADLHEDDDLNMPQQEKKSIDRSPGDDAKLKRRKKKELEAKPGNDPKPVKEAEGKDEIAGPTQAKLKKPVYAGPEIVKTPPKTSAEQAAAVDASAKKKTKVTTSAAEAERAKAVGDVTSSDETDAAELKSLKEVDAALDRWFELAGLQETGLVSRRRKAAPVVTEFKGKPSNIKELGGRRRPDSTITLREARNIVRRIVKRVRKESQ